METRPANPVSQSLASSEPSTHGIGGEIPALSAATEPFLRLWRQFKWSPIPGCPGRFTLETPQPTVTPSHLAGSMAQSFRSAAAKDEVLLVRFAFGALLSYRHSDGTFLHTLNTESGLLRKLAALGVEDHTPD